MISLSRHIESLMLKHDCVIVPGLGGFVTQYVAARCIPEENLFLPPYRSVGFNPRLTLNDGLLVQSYMQTYDTNYPETVKLIEESVNKLKRTLQEEGEFELSGIGKLTLGIGGHYEFIPCEAGVLSPELYGLDTLHIQPRVGLPSASPSSRSKHAHGSERKRRIQLKRTERDYTVSVNREIINYLAAAMVAVVFYFVWATPIGTPDNIDPQGAHTASMTYEQLFSAAKPVTPITKSTSSTAKPSVSPQASTTETSTGSTDVQPVQNTKPAAVTSTHEATPAPTMREVHEERKSTGTQTGGYTIVLASSITQPNAKLLVQQLEASGTKDAQVYIRRRMVRVICGHFPTEASATKALRQLRKQAAFADAWVMPYK